MLWDYTHGHGCYCKDLPSWQEEARRNHRITGYPELEGIHKDNQVQLLVLHKITPKWEVASSQAVVDGGTIMYMGKGSEVLLIYGPNMKQKKATQQFGQRRLG